MILFMILLVTLAILIGFIVLTVAAGGAVFIIVFADVIVCIVLIAWIMKHLFGRRKR